MTILFDEQLQTDAEVAARGALMGPSPASQRELGAHLVAHGAVPALDAHAVVRLAVDSGLTGHGGAGFPLYRKLEAVIAARGRAIVVGERCRRRASEREGSVAACSTSASRARWFAACRARDQRDRRLSLRQPPARMSPTLMTCSTSGAARESTRSRSPWYAAPDAFISGEETAVVSHLSGGTALPRFKSPRVTERGVRGRPTLVSNVETLALLALIARRGAAWFRSAGTVDAPGTMLLTVGGAVRAPGIVETGHGTPLAAVLALAGGPSTELQAVLLGGYHGTWLTADEVTFAKLSRSDLAPLGASPGAGVVVALGAGTCGLVEMSRVMSYLAQESAGQCGPCLNGLPRIANQLKSVAFGRGGGSQRRRRNASTRRTGRGPRRMPPPGRQHALPA